MPPRRRRRTSDQILAAIALLMVGAFAAFGVQSLFQGTTPVASGTPSAAPTDDTGGAGSTADTGGLPSDVPADSVPPVSPILEGRIPTSIDDVTLTIQSAVDATNLSNGPDGRALDAAVVRLGKQASDLEIALADDQSGTLDLNIIGFRANGVTATDMRKAVLEAWLAAGTPGVTTSTLTISGAEVTKVSYGDGGADEYVLTVGDSVFIVETSDATLAQSAASAIIAPGASPSTQATPAT